MAGRDNYIDVNLSGDARYQRLSEVYQYDHGMELRITG